jgi:small subunit ribosomal protein S3
VGQKVHPYIQRIGLINNWRSLWYADRRKYAQNIAEDYRIRKYIQKKFIHAAVSYIVIERVAADQIKVKIASARPGVIVGRRGVDIEKLKDDLRKMTSSDINIDILEIKNPTMEAQLVAQNIAFQLEKRVAFRRAVKRSIDQSRQSGALGVKVRVAGRLGGAEMARTETYHEGSLPLQTFRANVDYGFAEAHTTYGVIGVKVWLYKGQVIREKKRNSPSEPVRA